MMKMLFLISTAILFLLSGGACGRSLLVLDITSLDRSPFDSNLIKIKGIVSQPLADVSISFNGSQNKVSIAKDGSFYSHIDLIPGDNIIKVTAAKGNEEVIKEINLEFEPPLVVFLDSLNGNISFDKPMLITGYVTNPRAVVSITKIKQETETRYSGNVTVATVDKNGNFSASMQLEPGHLRLFIEAAYENKVDRTVQDFDITTKGELLKTSDSLGFQFQIDSPLIISRGEEKHFQIMMNPDRAIKSPEKFVCAFTRIAGPISLEEVPNPEGLSISLDPVSFTIWPQSFYNPEIEIDTTSLTPPGNYWFRANFTQGHIIFNVIIE